MHKSFRMKYILPTVGVFLFSHALLVLYRELHTYSLGAVIVGWRGISGDRTLIALVLTLISYLVMSGYDWVALREIKKPMPFIRVAFAAFISYAFSNNIGLYMLAGATVRFRLYSEWGLSAFDVTRVIGFSSFSIWICFFTLAGTAFLLPPATFPQLPHLPAISSGVIGIILLTAVSVLFLAGLLPKHQVDKQVIHHPVGRVAAVTLFL